MKQRQHPLYILLLLFLVVSCTVDTERIVTPEGNEGDLVIFTLRMPVQNTTTRAMSDEDENRVDQVDVLIFRPVDNQFVELVSTDDIETDEDEENLKRFTVRVRLRGETTIHLVVLGNARDILRDAFPDDEDMKGLSKDEVLSALKLTYQGSWLDAQGKAIRNFPMWGFRNDHVVSEDELTGEHAIWMTRMVVRVDVHVSEDARDDFKLNEVYVYNSYIQGNLAHSMTTGWDETEHKATAPDIPQTATSIWRVDYKDSPSPMTTPDISSERVVYTLEAPAGDENALLETTALVVGGIYEGEQYYYRVDFVAKDKNGVNAFIPLVRNHNYEINIQEVKGKGYYTPDEAFRKGMTNMELDILAWNEAGMGDITFGAQYQLTVNTDSFFFYSNGREQILKVYTDHPDGWVVVKEHEEDLPWLKINPLMGDPGESKEIKLSAEELLAPLKERSGYFYIQAGHLKKKIKVCQSLEAELYLEIEPNLLIFRRSAVSPETIKVTVDPDTWPVYLSWTGTDQFKWRSGGWPATGQVGVTDYVFHPEPNDSRNLLTGTITFSVSDETGKTTNRTVTVIHLPTDTRFDVEYQHNPYPAIGGDPMWMLTSAEAEWQITQNNITFGGLVTDQLKPENYDLRPAENFKHYNFKLEPNPLFEERTFNLKVTSPDPAFAEVDVPLVQDYARPTLEITSHNNLNIRFTHESDFTPEVVKFNVNTDWMYSATGNYNTSIQASVAEDVPQSGITSIHVPEERSITFTPTVFEAKPGTPEGGTEWKGTATLGTINHAPATAVEQSINFTQTVPHFFDRSTLQARRTNSSTGEVLQDGDIVPSGSTIYLEVGSNTHWAVESYYGGKAVNYTYFTFSNWAVARVPFSLNPLRSDPTFNPKEFKIYLDSYRQTVNGTMVVQPKESLPFLTLLEEPVYHVELVPDPAFDDPDFRIPYMGGSYEFRLEGYFPGNDINAGGFYKPAVVMVHSLSELWPREGIPPSGNGVTSGWIMKQAALNPGDYISIPLNVGRNYYGEREIKVAYGYTDQLLLTPITWFVFTVKQEEAPGN